MATIGIVMSSMLRIYVAAAGIVMCNMFSSCVKVSTSIDKPIYSVLQTEVHSSFLPHNQFGLAWTSCSVFSTSVGCY